MLQFMFIQENFYCKDYNGDTYKEYCYDRHIAFDFNKRENVKMQPGKYFKLGYPPLYFFYNILELAFPRYTGFYTVHGTYHFCKKTFNEKFYNSKRKCLYEK